MTQKSDLYNALKATGAPLTTDFAHYKVADLERELKAAGAQRPEPMPEPEMPDLVLPEMTTSNSAEYTVTYDPPPGPPRQDKADPNEMPGQRLNTLAEDEPIRVDEQGRLWFQEEVKKPAYPKPRGRRVLKYMDGGVAVQTVQNGEYVETFEVEGTAAQRPAEVKITLPSYQVGIYKDPRFPFKIHTYNGREGFNLFEVEHYYGGSELVPATCKRVYIENDLCYDVRSVIQSIQNEYRQLQLMGKA
jgi:hypothetical protein